MSLKNSVSNSENSKNSVETKNVSPQKEKKSKKTKKFSAVFEFFSRKEVKYTFGAIFLIIFGFLVQYFINRPNLGIYVGSDMDPTGNVYVMGVDEKSSAYSITKIDNDGSTEFRMDLDKSNSEYLYTYDNLEVDSKGNFYFVKRAKKLSSAVQNASALPLSSETVYMYDTLGRYVKKIADFDYTKDAVQPMSEYIRKIQLVGQNMHIICSKEKVYDVFTANPIVDESPKKIKSFTIEPTYTVADDTMELVNDMCVVSGERVVYSTRDGRLFAMDNQGKFLEYTNAISQSTFCLSGMTVDSLDNIYFTDTITGNFYKFSVQSVTPTLLYTLNDELLSKNSVHLKDVRPLKFIDEDIFYGASKAFDKVFYVRCGGEGLLVSDVRGKFLPNGLIIMLIAMAVVFGLVYLVKYLSTLEVKRIPLAVRIVSMFLPVCLLLMAALVYVNTSDAVNEYQSVLLDEQQRGALTIADNISGNDFSNLNYIKDYMSPEYMNVKKSIEKGYSDLLIRIGDKSDYIITYVGRYNKVYTAINTKMNSDSISYERLKHTKPDMASSNFCLVDHVLENDENNAVYDIWNQFSNKTNKTSCLQAEFRDVYGNITGSFAPIEDDKGNVVGMVGNFLDEDIHKNDKFWKIFKHSLAIILVIAVIISVYICFVVKVCLRPLKTIEKSIREFSKGEWDARVRTESKDELADIAETFNLMADKIARYTNNLIVLNKEYIRYVPSKIFKLMDKEKITQVKLHDSKVVKMNVIYVSFNISCKDSYDFKDEYELFDALNKSYEKMFKIVENNNGVVQSFDGLDAIMLFPNSVEDAFNAAVQFREVDINEVIQEHMNIVLGRGDALVGVSGTKDRRGVVVVSDEIMQMFNIDTQINFIGIKQVATSAIIKELGLNSPYSYRYIGKVGNINGDGSTDIYQIIDSTNKYRKDLYVGTYKKFDDAVKTYLSADFETARKLFTDVIRINENDKVSIHYLMKCEEKLSKNEDGQFKRPFTGNIV